MYAWLNRHWVAAALCMGIFLLLLAPILALLWTPALLLIFLQSPIYMLHQVEEHTGDRFKHWVNDQMFHGLEALTSEAILWINIPGVWGVNLVALYAAAFFGIGWGLAAVYLVLVNGAVHVMGAIVNRASNPGFWTALVTFLPIGGLALWLVSKEPGVHFLHHAIGLGVALAIHAAIVVHAKTRAAALASAAIKAPSIARP